MKRKPEKDNQETNQGTESRGGYGQETAPSDYGVETPRGKF